MNHATIESSSRKSQILFNVFPNFSKHGRTFSNFYVPKTELCQTRQGVFSETTKPLTSLTTFPELRLRQSFQIMDITKDTILRSTINDYFENEPDGRLTAWV